MTRDDVRTRMQAIADEYRKEYEATEKKLMDAIAALGDDVKAAGLDPVEFGREIMPILATLEKNMIETIKGG